MHFKDALKAARTPGLIMVTYDAEEPAYLCMDFSARFGEGLNPLAALRHYETKPPRDVPSSGVSALFELCSNNAEVVIIMSKEKLYLCIDKENRSVVGATHGEALTAYMKKYKVWQ